MIEVAKATGPGAVKIFSGKRVLIEGAVFQVESVDMRTKKVTLGVVNFEAAKAMFETKQETKPEHVTAPKLSGGSIPPIEKALEKTKNPDEGFTPMPPKGSENEPDKGNAGSADSVESGPIGEPV